MKISRLTAVEQRVNKEQEPRIRLTYSDGTIRNVGILDALDATILDAEHDFYPKEPYPITAEIIEGYERAPKLCDIVMQLCTRGDR